MDFEQFNFDRRIDARIRAAGYTTPTPIQQQAIPVVLAGRDVIGLAQTGTGKTAAFILPILQRLTEGPLRRVRALIVAPTRELAEQIYETSVDFGRNTKIRSVSVYGGVGKHAQVSRLRSGVEIVIACPGRLLDLANDGAIDLSNVEVLVLDEADRMCDMGFLPDIRRILALLPTQRQSLLFSATFSDDIKKLANQMLRSPTLIEVARRNAPADLVDHQVYEVETARKRALLAHLIRSRDMKQVLVFVRMKRDCNKLARELVRDGINATAIHSDRTQAEREQALSDFKEGRATVLVATDIAARGIDIAELPFVINYELPYTPEDYVHRIGRTGRAGLTGEAISLVSADENRLLVEIEKLLKRAIPRKAAEGGDSERARERRPRRESQEEPAREARPRQSSRPAASPKVASDGFDFSKPYQPSPSSTAKPDAEKPASIRPRGNRPTAALLGGLAVKDRK